MMKREAADVASRVDALERGFAALHRRLDAVGERVAEHDEAIRSVHARVDAFQDVVRAAVEGARREAETASRERLAAVLAVMLLIFILFMYT